MGLRPDPRCKHDKNRIACEDCKAGKVPMQGTMINGKLKSKVATKSNPRKRGWG